MRPEVGCPWVWILSRCSTSVHCPACGCGLGDPGGPVGGVGVTIAHPPPTRRRGGQTESEGALEVTIEE